ncbi:hypothetical protein Tco_0471948 [Tanacetum coccineum]
MEDNQLNEADLVVVLVVDAENHLVDSEIQVMDDVIVDPVKKENFMLQMLQEDNSCIVFDTIVMAMTAKEHVAEIKRTKFSIGGEPNPLTEDLHHAVKNLSDELYAKHNNGYPEGVDPSLEFVNTSKDITNTRVPTTLLVFNNENWFSSKNIDSVCSVGRSTKKGLHNHGYIGEKGIRFKSVEEDSILSSIQKEYGSSTTLPNTILVLPLRGDKTGDGNANESGYHMWKQRFPVKQENKVDIRREVEEWVVILAFPVEKRLLGSSRCLGISAFLLTDTVTNFPFIIQADFLLASSRENNLWDNKWNQGILD